MKGLNVSDAAAGEGGKNLNKSKSMSMPRSKKSVYSIIHQQPKEKPQTTKKFEAYVALRRSQMEFKHSDEKQRLHGEIQRFIDQNRLSQRVKYSPAIVQNSQVMRRRRHENMQMAKAQLKMNEKSWEDQKVRIQYNVAHRPLLVEQVSKAFISNLKQIRDLQRYVKILQEANLDEA